MMKDKENLNKQPHWRCRLCGHSTPLGQPICSNPSCGADLGIYGETVTPGQEDDGRRTWKQREEEARQREEEARRWEEEARRQEEEQRRAEAQQRKDEAQRQKAEERRRRAEEKTRAKADRQGGRSGGGAPKWLVPALAVLLVAALGIGAGVFFAGRSTAGSPVPPQSSSDPGPGSAQPVASDAPAPDETQPGQGEPPAPDAWKGNVLMADPTGTMGFEDSTEYPALGGTAQDGNFSGTFARKMFCSITFMDSLDKLHGAYWDVSQAQDGSVMAWADLKSTAAGLYDLYIGAEGGVEAPADCSGIFQGYINVESIAFNGAFHTENAADMEGMFYGCEALKTLDLRGLDTSGVTNMPRMFFSCKALETLDVGGFDTSRVTDMTCMFGYCRGLRELDVSGFDTAQVTDMTLMFISCDSLSALSLGNLDTSKVLEMDRMFSDCGSLRQLDVSGLDTSSVTNMWEMFSGCSSVTALDLRNFDTSNVTNMSGMFNGCSGLRELDVTSFDTSSVTNMQSMFKDCSGLTELDITNFRTSRVKNMSHMFDGVNSGFALHFVRANFDTSSVTNNENFMSDSFDWRKMFE